MTEEEVGKLAFEIATSLMKSAGRIAEALERIADVAEAASALEKVVKSDPQV